MKYDYLVVGAGLFGATFAYEAKKRNKKCLVIDKRDHIAGNVYTKEESGINVHVYGAHIFHTSDKKIWEYINQFAEFNNYINSPVAVYKDELYNLPFNMNTFSKMWNIKTPAEAKEIIEKQKAEYKIDEPKNLEEQALSLAGKDVYEKLIKGYTEKQWGRKCTELPSFIIKRLPMRFTYDNNYFNDRFQGIPMGGYTKIVEKMLDGIDVKVNEDFFELKKTGKLSDGLRQKGKQATLSCGYGGGAGALIAMGALEAGMKEDELDPLVSAWRKANPRIVQLWWAVDKAVKKAIKNKGVEKTHSLTFEYRGAMLYITLPSGRQLA